MTFLKILEKIFHLDYLKKLKLKQFWNYYNMNEKMSFSENFDET